MDVFLNKGCILSPGPNHKFVKDKMVEIYNVLKQKLWDDPNSVSILNCQV